MCASASHPSHPTQDCTFDVYYDGVRIVKAKMLITGKSGPKLWLPGTTAGIPDCVRKGGVPGAAFERDVIPVGENYGFSCERGGPEVRATLQKFCLVLVSGEEAGGEGGGE